MSLRNHVLDRGPDPPCKGAIEGKGWPIIKYIGTLCHKLCNNGSLNDRGAVWGMNSGGNKEACVIWGCTLT